MIITLFIIGSIIMLLAFVPTIQRVLPFNTRVLKFTGGVFMVIAILNTSFVVIPKHHIGLKYKKLMGSSNSRGIIGYDGENGRQADFLSEGMTFSLGINLLYDIEEVETTVIPDNMVGLITSRMDYH